LLTYTSGLSAVMLLIVVGMLIATAVVKDVEAWQVEQGILGVVVLERGILDQVDTGVDIPGPVRRCGGVPVAVTFCPLCGSRAPVARLPAMSSLGVSRYPAKLIMAAFVVGE